MELTRRDAVAVLTAAGLGGVAAYGILDEGEGPDDGRGFTGEPHQDHRVETLVSVAELVYPSEVEGGRTFTEAYVSGKFEADEEYLTEATIAVESLDEYAEERADQPFRDLPVAERDDLFRDRGMRQAPPEPDGQGISHVRYWAVNDLLYAMLTSPKGGEIMGIDSPPGYPGGLQAYQGEGVNR